MGIPSNNVNLKSPASAPRRMPCKRSSSAHMALKCTARSGGYTPTTQEVSPLAPPLGSSHFQYKSAKRRLFSPLQHDQSPTGKGSLPATPQTPTNSFIKAGKLSTPPARKQCKQNLQLALQNNDLVTVVEILAARPQLASLPLADGTSPLQCAVDLGCDDMIIELLQHHDANSGADCGF